jgi:hypothetical protein
VSGDIWGLVLPEQLSPAHPSAGLLYQCPTCGRSSYTHLLNPVCTGSTDPGGSHPAAVADRIDPEDIPDGTEEAVFW